MKALVMLAILACGCGGAQHRSSVVALSGGGASADGRVAWFMEARREVIDVGGDDAPPRDSLYVVRCAMGQVPMCTRTPVDWGNMDVPMPEERPGDAVPGGGLDEQAGDAGSAGPADGDAPPDLAPP